MIEQAISSLLLNNSSITDLIGTRVYPLVREQSEGLPAITYQLISAPRNYANTGAIGLVRSRIQINCFADDPLAASQLAAAVRAVLSGYQGSPESVRIESILLEDQSDLPVIEPENEQMNVYAKTMDFFILFKE